MKNTTSKSPRKSSKHRASFGGSIDRVKVSLRVFGEKLDPNEISRILRCEPTSQTKKGEVIVGPLARQRIASFGRWLLDSVEDEGMDLEEQIFKLLSRVSSDLEIWKELTKKYKVDLFCGLFLDES